MFVEFVDFKLLRSLLFTIFFVIMPQKYKHKAGSVGTGVLSSGHTSVWTHTSSTHTRRTEASAETESNGEGGSSRAVKPSRGAEGRLEAFQEAERRS